tara:strand:- start:1305 stop:1646 length:342 start_codon:yes stop_codon:yes gene_type:complete
MSAEDNEIQKKLEDAFGGPGLPNYLMGFDGLPDVGLIQEHLEQALLIINSCDDETLNAGKDAYNDSRNQLKGKAKRESPTWNEIVKKAQEPFSQLAMVLAKSFTVKTTTGEGS